MKSAALILLVCCCLLPTTHSLKCHQCSGKLIDGLDNLCPNAAKLPDATECEQKDAACFKQVIVDSKEQTRATLRGCKTREKTDGCADIDAATKAKVIMKDGFENAKQSCIYFCNTDACNTNINASAMVEIKNDKKESPSSIAGSADSLHVQIPLLLGATLLLMLH